MTDEEIRDMFAAHAITLANAAVSSSRTLTREEAHTQRNERVACFAYDIADAMMAERAKRK